jgi:hypothetical protein
MSHFYLGGGATMVELEIWPSRTFSFSKNCLREILKFLKNFRVCTQKGAKYLLFLAIAPQGKFFGILYLDSHMSRLYIFSGCASF